MKKFLIAISLLIVLFVLITVFKSSSGVEQAAQNYSEKSLAEKGNIQKFWQEYRMATRFRIDGKIEKAVEKYQSALALKGDHEDALLLPGEYVLALN